MCVANREASRNGRDVLLYMYIIRLLQFYTRRTIVDARVRHQRRHPPPHLRLKSHPRSRQSSCAYERRYISTRAAPCSGLMKPGDLGATTSRTLACKMDQIASALLFSLTRSLSKFRGVFGGRKLFLPGHSGLIFDGRVETAITPRTRRKIYLLLGSVGCRSLYLS